MRIIFAFTLLLSPLFLNIAWGADSELATSISCISDESTLIGRRIQSQQSQTPKKTQITPWNMKEQFGDGSSKVEFLWIPKGDHGPKVELKTTDRPHNLIKIRSRTKNTVILVSSTSNFYSSESWTFAINFGVQTMIATRVVSNANGVGSEQIAYHCHFEPL